MIGSYSVEAKYAMKLDVYRVQIDQDQNSGEIKRHWIYTETLSCLAKSIISSGVRSPSNDKTVDSRYMVEEILKVMTMVKLPRNAKISKIRDLNDQVLWEEAEISGNPATIFDIVGSTPIIDGFGQILEYETTIQRSDIQNALY
jgi:hypothetical protein